MDDSKFIYTIKIKKKKWEDHCFFFTAWCLYPPPVPVRNLCSPCPTRFSSNPPALDPDWCRHPSYLPTRRARITFPSPPRLPVHLVLPLPSPLQGRPPARGHALGVVSLAAHPTGARAAEVSVDSFAHVFDVDSGGLATLEAAPSKVWAVQFHPKVSTEHGCPTPVVRNQDFQGKKNGCFLAIFAAIMLDGSMGNEPNVWDFGEMLDDAQARGAGCTLCPAAPPCQGGHPSALLIFLGSIVHMRWSCQRDWQRWCWSHCSISKKKKSLCSSTESPHKNDLICIPLKRWTHSPWLCWVRRAP